MLVLKAPQSEVLAAVKRVAAIAPGKSTLPVLSNILLRRAGGVLSLTTTDLDVQAVMATELQGDTEDFATTIQARRLLDVLQTMAADQAVTATAKGDRLEVRGGKSRFNLGTIPATEFPVMKAVGDDGSTVVLPSNKLRGLLEAVGFASGVSDVRFYLNGTLLELTSEGITAVATDGVHMAKASIGSEAPDSRIILPRASSLHLLRLLPHGDQLVTVRVSSNLASFEFGAGSLTTKLVEGRFPDYRRAMPEQLPQSVTVGREPLLHALRAAAVVTTQKAFAIRAKFVPGELRFEAQINGEDADSAIDIDYGGPEIDLGFDSRKLLQGLESTDEALVRISFGVGQPLTMTLPEGDQSYRYVLMPMRL